MTADELKPLIGKLVAIRWRDPTGRSGWTEKPLADVSQECQTWGRIQGFNWRGELVLASTEAVDEADKDVSDRNVIPVALIEGVALLEVVPRQILPDKSS